MKDASCAASQVEDSDMSDEDGDEDEDEEISPIKPAKKQMQKQWAEVDPWWLLGATRWRFQEYEFCTRHRFHRRSSASSLDSTDVAEVQNHQTRMFHHLKMSSTVTRFWICLKRFQKVDSKKRACLCGLQIGYFSLNYLFLSILKKCENFLPV